MKPSKMAFLKVYKWSTLLEELYFIMKETIILVIISVPVSDSDGLIFHKLSSLSKKDQIKLEAPDSKSVHRL